MAIEKTTTFINVTALPPGDASASSDTNTAHPQLMVMEQITLDDTEDDTLPISQQTRRYINRYVVDGGVATNVSSEDALVQSVAGAIWS